MNEALLFIWSGGEPADLAKVKAAKAQLESDEFNPWATPLPKVRPVNCGPEGFGPTLEDRVLAIGSAPPFLCHYYLVGADAGLEEFVAAMAWVLHLQDEDERGTTLLDTMTAVFGAGTREVGQEELDAKQKLRDYQRNLR